MKKWFAVIGDPIAQSMSPFMHTKWFEEAGMDAAYIPVHVTQDKVGEAVRSLAVLGCTGWNVTVPHKTAIIPHLDKIDPFAAAMDAVNTVHLQDGELRGFNTDGIGFVRSLEEQYGEEGKTGEVLVIGSGGAAKGIAHALRESGYGPITITNRTPGKAEMLAQELGASAIPLQAAETRIGSYRLIVQTTSVGMNYSDAGMPLDPSGVQSGTIVCDIIYNPLETEFLMRAQSSGAKTLNGLGMFVHQGALAFETWTGVKPDTSRMIRVLTEKLGGKTC